MGSPGHSGTAILVGLTASVRSSPVLWLCLVSAELEAQVSQPHDDLDKVCVEEPHTTTSPPQRVFVSWSSLDAVHCAEKRSKGGSQGLSTH